MASCTSRRAFVDVPKTALVVAVPPFESTVRSFKARIPSPAAVGAGRAIAAQLFGVAGLDPVVLMAAPAVLAVVALLAAAWPSMKAAAVQPSEVLRHE